MSATEEWHGVNEQNEGIDVSTQEMICFAFLIYV